MSRNAKQAVIRANEMLGIAAKYIRQHWADGLIEYDETECDGYCVADDCESAMLTVPSAETFEQWATKEGLSLERVASDKRYCSMETEWARRAWDRKEANGV